jgi:predicted DNA-binding transcriptional regulator YafY
MRPQPNPRNERQWRVLWTLVSREKGATVRELAELTGFDERTIQRDLAALRRVGVPLQETVSSHGRKHWRLQQQSIPFSLNFEEAGGLYIGGKLVEWSLDETVFAQAARQALVKLKSQLSPGVRKYLDRWLESVHIGAEGASPYGTRRGLLDDVARAIEDRRIAFFLYQSPRATEPVEYEVYPLAVVLHKRSAYIEAWSPKAGTVKTFKLDRLHGCEVTAIQFQPPPEARLEQRFQSSFGVFHRDGPPVRVVVRFTGADVTQYVLEKTWPTEKRKTKRRDGSVELQLEVTALEEVASWIRSFGAAAEVLEPLDLRRQMRDEAKRVAALYGELEQLSRPDTKRVSPKG